MNAKRGQASFEYILIASVIGIMVLPAAYLFYQYSHSSADQIDNAQLDKLGRDIVATAEKVYYQGPPSRTELEARMPKNILNLSIVGDWNTMAQQLIILASSDSGPNDFSYPSGVNINGSFKGSLREITVSPGIKKISIEAYEMPSGPGGTVTSFVHINFGSRCPLSTLYDFDSNGLDASDRTFVNRCSCDADPAGPERYPKFRPTKTWQGGWFDNTGYAGGNVLAACINADYNADCVIDEADVTAFCSATGLCAPPMGCPSP